MTLKTISEQQGRKMAGLSAKTRREDLVTLEVLLKAGVIVPAIDQCYLLSETAEALRYLGTGHAGAKVVITMG